MKAIAWGAALAITTGCAGTSTSPAASSAKLPEANAEHAGSPFVVVTKDAIALEGNVVADPRAIDHDARPQRIVPLFEALRIRHAIHPHETEHWLDARKASGIAAVSAMMSAVFAGYRRVHLRTDSGWIDGDLDLPGPPPESEPAYHSRIIVRVGADVVAVGWQSDRACEVVPADARMPPSDLSRYLDEACERQPAPCVDIAHTRFTPEVPFPIALRTLATVRRHAGTRFLFTLLPTDEAVVAKNPDHTCATPIHSGINGRLPPEEIQRVVRARFDTLRACYEDGLERDPHLHGKLATRFVIDRDGHATEAKPDPESTPFPDPAVAKCVATELEKLVFPKPQGGVVTVVYPIEFDPGN